MSGWAVPTVGEGVDRKLLSPGMQLAGEVPDEVHERILVIVERSVAFEVNVHAVQAATVRFRHQGVGEFLWMIGKRGTRQRPIPGRQGIVHAQHDADSVRMTPADEQRNRLVTDHAVFWGGGDASISRRYPELKRQMGERILQPVSAKGLVQPRLYLLQCRTPEPMSLPGVPKTRHDAREVRPPSPRSRHEPRQWG